MTREQMIDKAVRRAIADGYFNYPERQDVAGLGRVIMDDALGFLESISGNGFRARLVRTEFRLGL